MHGHGSDHPMIESWASESARPTNLLATTIALSPTNALQPKNALPPMKTMLCYEGFFNKLVDADWLGEGVPCS